MVMDKQLQFNVFKSATQDQFGSNTSKSLKPGLKSVRNLPPLDFKASKDAPFTSNYGNLT